MQPCRHFTPDNRCRGAQMVSSSPPLVPESQTPPVAAVGTVRLLILGTANSLFSNIMQNKDCPLWPVSDMPSTATKPLPTSSSESTRTKSRPLLPCCWAYFRQAGRCCMSSTDTDAESAEGERGEPQRLQQKRAMDSSQTASGLKYITCPPCLVCPFIGGYSG